MDVVLWIFNSHFFYLDCHEVSVMGICMCFNPVPDLGSKKSALKRKRMYLKFTRKQLFLSDILVFINGFNLEK